MKGHTAFRIKQKLLNFLKNNMHILTNDQTMRELKVNDNLQIEKRLITKAKFTEHQIKTSYQVFKCNRPKVPFANALKRATATISITSFLVNETMSSDEKNVIYVIKMQWMQIALYWSNRR